jgi:hypothetical protein
MAKAMLSKKKNDSSLTVLTSNYTIEPKLKKIKLKNQHGVGTKIKINT